MEEEFYSTIKLTSGEEIIAKVCYLSDENCILVENPMLVEKISHKKNGRNLEGFVLKEWIHSTYESMFVIKMEQIVTMTELDENIENFYLKNINSDDDYKNKINLEPKDVSRRMGYLGSVKETKEYLEDIFNRS